MKLSVMVACAVIVISCVYAPKHPRECIEVQIEKADVMDGDCIEEEIIQIQKSEYSEEEIDMIMKIVQHEGGNMSETLKICIAFVVLNRVDSDAFPDTIRDVLLQKGQFMKESNYYTDKYAPNENTREVVEKVLMGEVEDLSHSALFYYAPKYASWSASKYFENNLTFLFETDGCRFFK